MTARYSANNRLFTAGSRTLSPRRPTRRTIPEMSLQEQTFPRTETPLQPPPYLPGGSG